MESGGGFVSGTGMGSRQDGKRLLARIGSNYGWSLVSDVGGKGFLFLVTIYLARRLGVEKFGLITYAQTLAAYFWLGVDLGINMYGAREIARDKPNAAAIINPLLTLRVAGGLAVFAVFVTVTVLIDNDPVHRMVYLASAFYLITRAVNIDWVMRGLERFEYMALGNFITFAMMLLLTVLLVKDESDVVTASYLWSFCYLLGGAAMLWSLKARVGVCWKPEFDFSVWRMHLRESLHFTAAGVLNNLYLYLPIIFVGLFSTKYEVGIFSAPFRVVNAVVFVLSILPLSLYPVFSEMYQTDRRRFDNLLYKFLAVSVVTGLIIGVGGTLLAREITLLFFGEQYLDGVWVLVIIMWFSALVPVRLAFRTVIAASGHQRYYTIVSAVGVGGFTAFFFAAWKLAGMGVLRATCVSLVLTEVLVLGMAAAVWYLKGAQSLDGGARHA